jgi:hypothetical protein
MALTIAVMSGDDISVDFKETGDKKKMYLFQCPSNLTIK